MSGYVFRLKAVLGKSFTENDLPGALDLPGFPPIEVNVINPNGSKSGDNRYAFIARGFTSDAEALSAGERFGEALLVVGALRGIGVRFDGVGGGSQWSDEVKKRVEAKTGIQLLDDKFGVMTYKDGAAGIASISGELQIQTRLKLLGDGLSELRCFAGKMSDRQKTCARLLNDAQFVGHTDAEFVLLVAGVEALCDQYDLSPDHVRLVEQLEAHLEQIEADPDSKTTLKNTLSHAKSKSIRQSYMEKFKLLLGKPQANLFDDIYRYRSEFVHDGKRRGEFATKVGELRQLAMNLFSADLRRTASLNEAPSSA